MSGAGWEHPPSLLGLVGPPLNPPPDPAAAPRSPGMTWRLPSSTCSGSRLSEVSMMRPSSRLPWGGHVMLMVTPPPQGHGGGSTPGHPRTGPQGCPTAALVLIPVPPPCQPQCHPGDNPTPLPVPSQGNPRAGPSTSPSANPRLYQGCLHVSPSATPVPAQVPPRALPSAVTMPVPVPSQHHFQCHPHALTGIVLEPSRCHPGAAPVPAQLHPSRRCRCRSCPAPARPRPPPRPGGAQC